MKGAHRILHKDHVMDPTGALIKDACPLGLPEILSAARGQPVLPNFASSGPRAAMLAGRRCQVFPVLEPCVVDEMKACKKRKMGMIFKV